MLRTTTAMLCFLAASAIPTSRDAPARTDVKAPTEVKALNDQVADLVAKQLAARDAEAQKRDDEAKKVAALAAEKEAKLEANLEAIADKIAHKMVHAKQMACPDVFTPSYTCCNPSSIVIGNACGVNAPSMEFSVCQSSDSCKQYIVKPSDPVINTGSAGSACFAKDSSTACLLASPAAECEHVLMSDLAVGDLVLGRGGATAVIAVQHKAVDTISEMLTFHTAAGAVSMTPDHAVFADGELVAAAQVKIGSLLSTGAVKRITKGEGSIINAVTASGTIVADGILAASNPMWIASLTVDAPIARAVVNAAIYAVGDADTVAAGFAGVLAKIAATAAVAVALKKRKASA